jgi:hypothetical protein
MMKNQTNTAPKQKINNNALRKQNHEKLQENLICVEIIYLD